ncbi:MAG: M20/M25/M40 family metallo-hydrolase [Acidobacteriota bacterium]
MLRRKILGVMLVYAILLPTIAFGQTAPKIYDAPPEVLAKIKDEGTKNSQIMKTLSYLSDVIGPRLTASPGMKRANDWTRETLASFGLQNAHLEPWGPFGRGWTLKRFSAMVDGPTAFPLISYPKAWSPGTDTLIAPPAAPDPKAKKGKTPPPPPPAAQGTAYTGEVVRFNATKAEELDQYKGKLKGKIVLLGAIRDLPAHFDPQGVRTTDRQLLDLADAPDPATIRRPAGGGPGGPGGNFAQAAQFNAQRFRFLADEGAAIIVDSARGDGGTMFVQQATAVQPPPAAAGAPANPPARLYDKGTRIPIQVSAAAEHFNRVARMLDAGEKVTMTVDLAVEYQDADLNGYNTVAEIPGSDKADEVVMLGGHLDSWHSGTGATDNGAGCAVMMEAVRIIQALGLKPRRTIRIALWTGEEQGLLGSRAYVKQHFGYLGDGTTPAFGGGGGGGGNATPQKLTKLPEYDKLSAYYNIDNGTGKIRGIYEQGNDNVRYIFKDWFGAFKDPKWYDKDKPLDMSAYTISVSNTGGTDHQSFDAIGLPGFQFIQDEIEYNQRTHHSNMDVFDRIQADDMKQMAIILATFVYQTAMMDDKMPKKNGAQ